MNIQEWSDQDIREVLKKLDEDEDVSLSRFASGFLDDICYGKKAKAKLSDNQRSFAIQLIEENGYQDH